MPDRNAWQHARKILCIRLDAMGDVLMTGPALRALRAAQPDRQLTLLTSRSGAEAARLMPWIDETIVYDAPWMKHPELRIAPSADIAMIESLARARFDAAVIFTVYSQNPLPAALVCYLADIPLRLAHCRENSYHLLTDWLPDPEPQTIVRHEVRRQLDLISATGCRTDDERMAISIPEPAMSALDGWLKEHALEADRNWVVIHPGSSAASRRYPAESFAVVAQRLVQEYGLSVVFTGSAQESETVDAIQRAMGGAASLSLAGALSLADLAALIARAPLLISNNTGPVHIAAAVGTPVVDLYALTNPQHTPWGVPHRVLNHDVPCKYCYKSVCPEGHHNCLRLVPPAQVTSAAIDLLGMAAPVEEDAAAAGALELVERAPASGFLETM